MHADADLSAIALRFANLGDARVVAAIHAACFARSWDEAAMAQLLADPACLSLLASTEHDPQASIIARFAADKAELLTLCVAKGHRRQGLARALLQSAVAFLKARGAKQLFLEVEDGNAPALGLYRSFGAVPVGRGKSYYEDGADAAIFSLAL